jgi:cell division protein FtsL
VLFSGLPVVCPELIFSLQGSEFMEGIMPDSTSRTIPKVNGFSLHRPQFFPFFLFISIFLVLSLFFVWSRVQAINLEYDISSFERHLREVRQESRQLRLEAASLRNPSRIEEVAKNELGLGLPAPEQVITVR